MRQHGMGIALVVVLMWASVASAGLDIVVSFDDNAYVWTPIEKAVVNQAITDWEEAFADYKIDETVSFGIDHRDEGGAAGVTYLWSWGDPVTRPWLNTGHYMGILPWSLTWDATPTTDNDVTGYDALHVVRHEIGHMLGVQAGYSFDPGWYDLWTSEIVGNTFDPGGLNVGMNPGDYGHTSGGLMDAYVPWGQRLDVGLTSLMLAKAFDLELRGDFDFDGDVDADDIDSLTAAVLGGSTNTLFDVDNDGDVDADDRAFLIANLAHTSFSSFDGVTGVWSTLGTAPGDFNLDGAVDLLDLNKLTANYNGTGGWVDGDANGDGSIELLDLNKLTANYNFTVVVPEPMTMSLLAIGGVAVLRKRRSA
jgi:hypothetical protein